jgi:pimeloyl-ACP methyl ester carboxylesterase
VFIHGFLGDIRSWTTFFSYYQSVKDQMPWSSYDAYSFEYPTRMYAQPPLKPNIVHLLDSFLLSDGIRERYETVVLAGHSQGGLLAKLYVLDKVLSHNSAQLKVEMIITVCTPHLGPRWPYSMLLRTLAVCERVPVLGLGLPYRQARDLCSSGENIGLLRDYWRPPFVTSGHIRSVAMVGRKDPFVSERSARGFSVLDELRYIDCHHSVEPSELEQPFFEYLDAHQRPTAILEELASLNDDRRLAAYCQSYAALAESSVRTALTRRNQPASQHYVTTVASAMLLEFPRDFIRRPLRKLTFASAIENYIIRRVEG